MLVFTFNLLNIIGKIPIGVRLVNTKLLSYGGLGLREIWGTKRLEGPSSDLSRAGQKFSCEGAT